MADQTSATGKEAGILNHLAKIDHASNEHASKIK
jgi:hypothetical protein